MVTLVKHEWHQVDSQFAYELDEDTLAQIYPDLKKREIKKMLKDIENGDIDVETIIDDAWNNDVEIEWERQYDDWWTDRKGGYEVTYELGDDDSWQSQPEEAPPYMECTKCRWKGGKYDALTQYLREDGTVIEDYMSSDEDCASTKDVCPMCDSEIKLTEYGEKEDAEYKKRMAEIDAAFPDEDEENISEEDLDSALDELKREFDLLVEEADEELKKKK